MSDSNDAEPAVLVPSPRGSPLKLEVTRLKGPSRSRPSVVRDRTERGARGKKKTTNHDASDRPQPSPRRVHALTRLPNPDPPRAQAS
jgi:hypothetical protein